MGILSEIRRDGHEIKELRLVNAHGRRIGGFNVDVFRTAANGRDVTIARGDLARKHLSKNRRALRHDLRRQHCGITLTAHGVHVTFEHARPRDFDAVIGADGLHSIVRKLVFGNEESFEIFLGYSVAAFAATDYQPRDEDTYITYSLITSRMWQLLAVESMAYFNHSHWLSRKRLRHEGDRGA